MIRAVLYLRSSKDRSDVSIDAQRRSLHELAAARGFAVVGEYADAVESGKDDDRPGFQSLIADIRAAGRTWDHILALDTSRIARRRVIGIIFEEHECKRRGVRVIYKSLPEADPITEMLLKSILQAMDEWHSLTSKVKGLSGMAENVRQGWRAGGRAPRGYVLATIETGAIRDGAPVTKTRLAKGPEADRMAAYLKARAKGVPRARAAREAGIPDVSKTSLIDIDRNALAYAGHTVWNRHAERDSSGYIGGSKMRPRSEWVVQRDTHDALITEAEAEAILAAVDSPGRRASKPGARVYLLSGLLVSPAGDAWNGDSGFYRLGRGARVSAEAVERAVVGLVMSDLASDAMASAVAEHYRRLSAPAADAGRRVKDVRRKVAEIERRIARLTALLSETSAPEALLRQVEALEAERTGLLADAESAAADAGLARALRSITVDDVRRRLAAVAEDMASGRPEVLRDTLRAVVARVEMDPITFDATVCYRVESASKAGSSWRPHGDPTLNPVFQAQSTVSIPHNRRLIAA